MCKVGTISTRALLMSLSALPDWSPKKGSAMMGFPW